MPIVIEENSKGSDHHNISLAVSQMRTIAQTPELFNISKCNQVKMTVKPFCDIVQKDLNFCQMQRKLSMQLVRLSLGGLITLGQGHRHIQEVTVANDGDITWPLDTHLTFSGSLNSLKVKEEIYIGMLEPGKQAKLDIEISAPGHSRYQKLAGRQINLSYEVRYNFLTHAIGSEINFKVQLSDD